MDGAGGNDGGPAGGPNRFPPQQQQQQQQAIRPGDHSRAVRAELERQQRLARERAQRYQPAVHAQMQRVLGDTRPAWYASLRLMPRALYSQMAEMTLVGLAVQHDRPPTDPEARAVTEHVARGMDANALVSWGLTFVAAGLTWRGRRTLRFPMFTPTVPMPPAGAYLRLGMWHGARFVAYSFVVSFFGSPLLGMNLNRVKKEMAEDPRLVGFRTDESAGGNGAALPDGFVNDQDYGQQQQQQQQQSSSIQEAAQPGWDSYRQPSSQAPPQPQQQQQGSSSWGSYSQQSNSGWDSDDFDDASPVAASAQDSSSYGSNGAAGGSAWDRLRRESQQQGSRQPSQTQQQQSGNGSWGQSAEGQSWGNSGDSAERSAQEKAQRDFDQMLERDRRGEAGQERGSWGRN